MTTEAERKVLKTLAEAATYSGMDTIKKEKLGEMGLEFVWTVEVSFGKHREAVDFQMAIDDVLQHPTPQPVVWVREVDAGTDNACWMICAKGDPGARMATVD